MVIRHTIHALRERPHDERHAFAALCAIAVMVVLFFGWMYVFFSSDQQAPITNARDHVMTNIAQGSQSAAAVASVQDIIQQTVTSDIGASYSENATTTPADDQGATYMDIPSAPASTAYTQPQAPQANPNNDVVRKLQQAAASSGN